jgi:hypothetical protein
MDKKLLEALNNLSAALEEIGEALKDSKEGKKSATTEALQAGDFTKELKQINLGIQSIKKDTQDILKQQKTILEISKKKEDDKKTGMFEKTGDKKNESNLKKGIGVILLIAIAVLAIGMAFKLVGKVDFMSVIALSLAMVIISVAFEKIGKTMALISMRDAYHTVIVMVLLAVAIAASSWILGMVKPIGFAQLVTAVLIAGMFAVMSSKLESLFIAVAVFRRMRVKASALLKTMVAIAAGITASSWVLAFVRPIGFAQAITAILIAGMFAVISYHFERLAIGVTVMSRFRITKMDLVLTLSAIAAAITVSSWILALVNPLSFGQAITGILIAVMFAVISINLEKIAIGVVAFKRTRVKATDLLLVLVGIAAAITVSSWILSLVVPITFSAFLTALGIAILFALMSYVMPEMAIGIAVMDKTIGSKKMLAVVPLVFVAISLAIMLSSHILSMTADMDFMFLLKLLVFGVILGIVILAMMPSVLLVGIAAASGVGAGAILLGAAMIPVIALAIMLSSHILAEGKYKNYPGVKWALGVGASMIGFGLAMIELGIVAITGIGAAAILAGGAMVLLVAATVVETSKIIAKGKYEKYPGLGWILSVGVTMTSFGAAIIALGVLALTGLGLIAVLAGAELVPMIAQTIVDTDKIIAKGKYDKYPGLGWILSVGTSMTGFGAAVVALGVLSITGLGLGALAIIAGTKMVPKIAQTIVETDRIIAKGKYEKYPGLGWILSVGSTMTGFGAAVVGLGILSITGLGLGALAIIMGTKMVPKIAETIVETDRIIAKGKYDKYPGWQWALSVGSLMTGFGLAVVTLGTFVVGTFGLGGLAIKAGAKAVKTIAQSIVDAAWIFKGAEGAFTGGPKKEWAEGVSLALGAFSPIYGMMLRSGIINALFGGGGVSPDDYASAIRTISRGVVDAGKFFGSKEANVAFTGGPKKEWAEGVGKAIGAFAPVYKMLFDSKNANFWTGAKGPTIESYVSAIKTISRGIIASAQIFAGSKVGYGKGTYPSVEWGKGVGGALSAFAPVFRALSGAGWFQSGKEAVNDMIYGVKMMSYAIVKVGKIFAWSKLKWDVTALPSKDWVSNLKVTIMSYVNLSSFILDSDYAPSSLQDDNVIKIGRSLVDFAKEIEKGGDAFQVKIDPDYMKNMSSNIFYYMEIANKLTKETSMKSLLKNAVFGDPISNIATSMMKLAIAYDKMGSSLMRFNRAVNQLDEKKINTFKGLNSNMISRGEKGLGASVGGAVGSVVSGAGNLVGGVLNSLTSLITPKSDKRSNAPKKEETKGKYGTMNQQMDKLVDIMKQLTENTKSLEKFIQEKLNEDDDPNKKKSKS